MFIGIKTDKWFKISIWAGLLALVIIIFSQKIEFTAIDLGRHLENGKLVWQNKDVLFKNFYSYTEPNFPFVNHHWLGGVIFYGVYLIGGFKLLSLFNILIMLSAFSLAFKLAIKKAGFYLSSFLAIPVIFLLSQRTEVRPEIFSYLFIILTWLVIDRVNKNKNYRQLFWLIPLFILWANIHIYFFIGLIMIGCQAAAEFLGLLFKERENLESGLKNAFRVAKPWIKSLVYVTLACLVNPNTYKGLVYPFNIFHNYGYEVAENKSVFYLGHLMINHNFLLFKILLFLLILSWLAYFVFEKKLRLFDLFLSVFFSLLALLASRNLAIFGLVAGVIISTNLLSPVAFLKENISFLKNINQGKYRLYLSGLISLIILFGIFYLILDSRQPHNFIKNSFGWGLATGSADSRQFFKDNNLSGPIFNNYDLGSALIFWLDSSKAVFVDNRPEAYSREFFANIYRPLQTDLNKWQEYSQQYQFKTIYFSHTDMTPWAQQFLRQILSNDDWALIYFDRELVILSNKKLTDAASLKKLTIDNWRFRQKFRELVVRSNLAAKFKLAVLAENAKQLDLAEEVYREILMNYPDDGRALASLGYLFANQAKRESLQISLKYLERALQAGYKLPSIYNQLALDHWQLKEYQKAELNWRSALKLNRHDESAVYYLEQVRQLKLQGVLPKSP